MAAAQRKLRSSNGDTRLIPLAWCGWRMSVPGDWRPLRIEGTWRRGSMMVGTATEAMFQIKWWRPSERRFDAGKWMKHRAESMDAWVSDDPPHPPAFSAVSYLPDVSSRGGGSRSVWYGYSAPAGIMLEMAVNHAVSGSAQKGIRTELLPGLTVTRADEETRWAIYRVGFVSPAGYEIREWRLYSGDISLRLGLGHRHTLVLRQVYPSDIALSRRPMDRWLRSNPFKEHRRYKALGEAEAYLVCVGESKCNGMKGLGKKRLAFPLGWVSRRNCISVVAEDSDLGRLLVAEHDSPDSDGEDVVRRVMRDMNWALRPVPTAVPA